MSSGLELPIPKVTPDERLVAREGAPDSSIYPYLPEVELPDVYRGGFPELPIDLDEVGFIGDAGLTAEQRKMLAQNGFVVVPGHHSRFSSAYNSSGWTAGHDGKGSFMTTDALLNTLGQLFTSAQKDLDQGLIGSLFSLILIDVVTTAVAQWTMAAGTPLEEPARRAAVYYAVAALAMNGGTDSLPAPIRAAAEAIYVMIAAGQGTAKVQILTNYDEDFSQYRPRSYYADSTALSRYFRAMMWLGRITFRTADRIDTQTGLLAMRALAQYDVYERWTRVDDLLASFIGPSDDLGPRIVLPIMREVYGEDLPLAALADKALTDQVVARLLALPEPKINSRAREFPGNGPKHGLCIFGQRFTFDAYAMQILVYSNVGTRDRPRTLPMVEDVAAVLGSDLAFAVTDAAGAPDFLHYTEYLGELREEVNTITAEAWQETLYGGWLSALQPLLVRTDTQYPPMMRADAWKYKDLNTFAGSYTQIKHATTLYAKEVVAWLCEADSPPKPYLKPHHVVEPNPLVFARIAILAGTLRSSLRSVDGSDELTGLCADLVKLASKLAAEAARELRGEPILETNDGLFGDFTQFLEDVQECLDPAWLDDDTEPFEPDTADGTVDIVSDRDLPDWLRPASLGAAGDSGVSGAKPRGDGIIADIASDPNRGNVLYSAIGNVDTLWVVTDSPHGLQLTRGFVYSTYQFTGDIQSRLTDDDWRARVEAGDLPPRPSWSSTYMAP